MITLGRDPSRYATAARKRSTRLPRLSPQSAALPRGGMYSVVASALPVAPSKTVRNSGPSRMNPAALR